MSDEERGDIAALKIVYKEVSMLTPYQNNAKTHEPYQIQAIAESIAEFGFNNPVLLDGEKGIIAGHGRVKAAQELGMDRVPTIELSHLTDTQRRAYILADNRLSEIYSGWDVERVKEELATLELEGFNVELLGFEDGFFAEEQVEKSDTSLPPDIDDMETLLVTPQSPAESKELYEEFTGRGLDVKII